MNVQEPIRTKHSYRQQLNASPEQVFTLLCPVRECEWVDGWNPSIVYSSSGYAEPNCVFITPDEDDEAVWVITQRDEANHVIEFVKVTPGITVGNIHIALQANENGGTEAEVSYMYTALSEKGERVVERFTEVSYQTFMKTWEDALNHYLATGEKLQG